MKKVKLFLFILLLSSLPLLSGCMTNMVNPLSKVEATAAPGLSMQLHAASASETNVDVIEVPLYYRFLTQPMLASETRSLTVPRDESMEMAVIKALLEGPSSGYGELSRLFPVSVTVESVISRENVLFITFSESLLTDDPVPANWRQLSEWAQEAPLRRKLTIQSLVATITESFSYLGVQVLVHQTNQTQTSLRLDNGYFLSEAQGLSQPQARDESLLLTPQNTAKLILEAWQSEDSETLYTFLSNTDSGVPKPSYQEATPEIDQLPTLLSFTIAGGGSISTDGKQAVMAVDLTILQDGQSILLAGYPLSLTRENHLWRIRYSQLQQLMQL